MSGRGPTILIVVAVAWLVTAAIAAAAPGALTYRDCLSGETNSTSCSHVPGATATGSGSGLQGIRDLELSPDDRSVYLAAQFDGSVAEFDRNTATGAVSFSGCHTGSLALTTCAAITSATANGDNSGLFDPETLALTTDGDSLYANVEADTSIAHFTREPFIAPPAADTTAPDTTLTARPKSNTKQRRASFSFISTEAGSTFLCAIDEEAFVSCSSPLTTRKLRRRRHTFQVRAIDSAGNADSTPATANWKVRRKKRRK